MKLDIICPLYNAEKYIIELNKNILKQKKVDILNIKYLLTESSDGTEKLLKDNKIGYELIKKQDFSHSLTREKYALKSEADILVFITQDIKIEKDNWLYELVIPIITGESEAAFSRQLCKDNSIEKYTREKNYPSESRIVSKKDIKDLGLNAFFFSDASSAIKKDVFVELNGYDNKNLTISEDMYIAYKIINAGYKIKYCAKSEVVHSHNFTLKEQYDRYKLTGKFFKDNSYLDNYGTNKSGGSLAKYILKRAIQDKNVGVIINFMPNMLARFIGMKMGKYGK
jgi:rhamnosyltransferase